jgi:hypothetical protein
MISLRRLVGGLLKFGRDPVPQAYANYTNLQSEITVKVDNYR